MRNSVIYIGHVDSFKIVTSRRLRWTELVAKFLDSRSLYIRTEILDKFQCIWNISFLSL